MSAVVLALLAAACSGGDGSATTTTVDLTQLTVTTEAPAVPLDTTPAVEQIVPGGVVRVGMWAEPDPSAEHLGGAIVRALVYPQLFTPRPDGGWAPSLVEPGSEVEAEDLLSVSFALRPGAVWSDGSPITVADLAASADERFVVAVTDAGEGRVRVEFTQPLPGWRRLWSGADVVRPSAEGVFGGPFRVAAVTAGLETVLVPNDAWWSEEGPFLDELRLVVVPDQTTLMQLFERGELDVVAPWAAPGRVLELSDAATGGVDVAGPGGWEMVVLVDPDVGEGSRRSILSAFDVEGFAGALLKGEAQAGPLLSETRDPGDLGDELTLTVPEDVAMLPTATRGAQIQVGDGDGRVPELRAAPFDVVAAWDAEGDYEVLVVPSYLGPSPCYLCRYGELAEGEARRADAGEPDPLRARLDAQALARTLWEPWRAVAWHEGVGGVEANGWALFATWNAWRWHRTDAG